MNIQYSLLMGLMLLLMAGCGESKKSEASPGVQTGFWPTSTFEQEGLREEPIDTLLAEIKKGTYGYVDELLLLKNGQLVLHQTFNNDYKQISQGFSGDLGCGYKSCADSTAYGDFNYYHPYWHPYYHNRKVHTLQSITKSVSSLLIGIAIDQGHIESTRVKLTDYLEDYDLSNTGEYFQLATLEDLLTMRLGMEWYEIGAPMDNNTTGALEASSDWIQFTLDQPMDTLPGTTWVYNSGASQLMSVILKKATGYPLDAYAREFLFGPLGIEDFFWKSTPKGYRDALGGLYLKAEDLAKIGYLVLNRGTWEGKQLVSREWIERSTTRISDSTQVENTGYGYQWWRQDSGDTPVWSGMGFGGQSLLIFPELQMVGVVYSWNIFDQEVPDIRLSMVTPLIEAHNR